MTEYGKWRSLIDGASVIPDSDIAQFEQGSLDSSFGSTSDWAVESSTPELTGTYTLHSKVNNPETILSTDGSLRYVEQDQRSACYVYSDTGGKTGSSWAGLSFGGQDTDNFYYVANLPSSNEIVVGKYENASLDDNRAAVSTSFDTWYDLEFDWLSDGTIEVRIFEVDSNGDRTSSSLGSSTYSDSTWSSGGIGFQVFASAGRPSYDNWRVLEVL
mgnify:CR=1 FL=1